MGGADCIACMSDDTVPIHGDSVLQNSVPRDKTLTASVLGVSQRKREGERDRGLEHPEISKVSDNFSVSVTLCDALS